MILDTVEVVLDESAVHGRIYHVSTILHQESARTCNAETLLPTDVWDLAPWANNLGVEHGPVIFFVLPVFFVHNGT
jgi:hypothetical protein